MFRSCLNKISLLFIGLIVVSLHSQTAVAPAVGDGSEVNPYRIATLKNLYWIAADSSHWKDHFVQTADINAAETKSWFGDSGWVPIGNLSGTYNGKGHHIDSLFINRTKGFMVGLFGSVYGDGARIDSLGLTGVNIKGAQLVGGLTGSNDGTISNCFCTGSIIGTASNYSIMVGGLVGENYAAINDCYTACTVSGYNNVGGLSGGNKGTLSNCFTTNTVSGSDDIGGLVGYNYSGTTVSNCYSTSAISCTNQYAGGLMGHNDGEIKNCYSAGAVNGAKYMGGLMGYNYGVVTNSFWDTQRSGLDTSAGGTGKTTAEMKTAATFTNAGWDFIGETVHGTLDIWGINSIDNSGFPFLKWQGFKNGQTQLAKITKVYTASDIFLKREGTLLLSQAGTIDIVNLNGKVISKSRAVGGKQYIRLSELSPGIFIARSGTESLKIVNTR
jgi:hypothetical protein